MNSATNIQIAIRVRPLNSKEINANLEPLWQINKNSISQIDLPQVCYSFDQIFNPEISNSGVYDTIVKPLIKSCLSGINSTIFAYGQTSSGKTHTIHGNVDKPGIINYAIEDIFKYINENTERNFLLRCSYLEIYNEKINDLLDENSKDIKIRENPYQGVHVVVKEEVIKEKSEFYCLMKKGMKIRKIGCTDMNERSSRSHTIFKLIIQSQKKDSECSYTESSLSLVDLSGSERVGQMELKGERQAEGVLINKSLTTLGLVIRKLSENEPFINYRDSKLTRLLQDSLGGNSKTLIICTITPAAAAETKSTLEFAQRAKYVKNLPIVNEKVTDKDQLKQYTKLCENYKKEIEQLNSEKMEKEKTISALQDKISNIELFSFGTSSINKMKNNAPHTPNRRHTLANCKNVHKKIKGRLFNKGSELEDIDEEDLSSVSKFNDITTTTNNKENFHFNNDDNNLFDLQKSPGTLLKEKQLLEESYESLKYFTNYENRFLDRIDEVTEFQDLNNRLRNENIELNENLYKERQENLRYVNNNKDIFESLILLKSILKNSNKTSLDTIYEEQLEVLDNNEELLANVLANNIRFVDQENTTSAKEWQNKIDELAAELEKKTTTINNLNSALNSEREIKEAELEILNNQIKKLTEYKNHLHEKLSKLHDSDDRMQELDNLRTQNNHFKKEIETLKLDYEQMYIKMKELEAENYTFKSTKQIETNLEKQLKELLSENSNLKKRIESQANTLVQREDNLKNISEKQVATENEKVKLEELCNTLNRHIKDYEKQIESRHAKHDSKLQKINELNQEIEVLKTEQKKMHLKMKELETENCTFKSTREMETNLEEQLKELLSENSSLKNTIESQTNTLMQREDNFKNISEKQVATENEKVKLEELCNTLNRQITDYEKQIESRDAKYDSKWQKFNELNQEIEVLKTKQKEMHLKMKELETENGNYKSIEAVKTNLEKELMKLQLENSNLNNTIQLHENKLKNINELQIVTEQEKIKLQELCNTLNTQLKEYESRSGSNVTMHCNQCDLKIEELNKELFNLQIENNNLSQSLKTKSAITAEQINNNLQLTSQLSDIMSQISILKLENFDLKKSNEEKSSECISISKSLCKIQEENARISKIKQTLENECNDMLKELNNRKIANDAQLKQLKEAQGQIDMLEAKCNKRQHENDQLKDRINSADSYLIKELTELREKMNRTNIMYRDKVQELTDNLRQSEKQITNLNEALESASLNLKKQEHFMENLRRDKIHSQTQTDNLLNTETEQLRIKILELTSEIKQTEENHSKILRAQTIENDSNLRKIKELEKRIKNDQITIEELNDTINKQKYDIETLKSQFDTVIIANKEVLTTKHLARKPDTNESIDGHPENDLNSQKSRDKKEQLIAIEKKKEVSPIEIRKLKRRSLQDQKRGLIINNENDNGCYVDDNEYEDELLLLDGEFPLRRNSREPLVEMKSSSPRQLRKMKVQLIHDQRRGLMHSSDNLGDLSNGDAFNGSTFDNILNNGECAEISSRNLFSDKFKKMKVCDNCASTQLTINQMNEEKVKWLKKIENYKEKINYLNDVNQEKVHEMKLLEKQRLELSKDLEKSEEGLRQIQNLRSRLQKFFGKFLDLEMSLNTMCNVCNAAYTNMHFNMLQADSEHSKFSNYYTAKCTELEKIIRDLQTQELQVNDSLMKKYQATRAIAVLRRKEGNYLRAQLNLPPDCPVLPSNFETDNKQKTTN